MSYIKKFINGNVAFAYGAMNAGLELFAGYPITPSTDVLEVLAKELNKNGGVYLNAASEIEAINILMGAGSTNAKCLTATSGCGFSLMQETISYMAADYIPAVILNVQREGAGLGDIPRSQGDYNQMTKGGGNGDYHSIVLSCSTIKDCYEMPKLAFSLAEKYQNPVIVTYDSDVAHIRENIDINIGPYDISHKDIDTSIGQGKNVKVQNKYYNNKNYVKEFKNKYDIIEKEEQRANLYETNDSEILFVAYGICSRICREVVLKLRKENIKCGLLEPVTLYPFPEKYFEKFKNVKKVIVVELSILGQMVYDVRLSLSKYKINAKIEQYNSMSTLPKANELMEFAGGI